MWWIPFIIGIVVGGVVGFLATAMFSLAERNSMLADLTTAEERAEQAERRARDAVWRWEQLVETVSARTDQTKWAEKADAR